MPTCTRTGKSAEAILRAAMADLGNPTAYVVPMHTNPSAHGSTAARL